MKAFSLTDSPERVPKANGETKPILHRTTENHLVSIVVLESQSIVNFCFRVVNNRGNALTFTIWNFIIIFLNYHKIFTGKEFGHFRAIVFPQSSSNLRCIQWRTKQLVKMRKTRNRFVCVRYCRTWTWWDYPLWELCKGVEKKHYVLVNWYLLLLFTRYDYVNLFVIF